MKGASAGIIKLTIQAGKANPAPPVGPALGQKGLNIMEFCKQFNALTAAMAGPVPVEIHYKADKKFTIVLKTPPASYLIKQAAGIEKGSQAAGIKSVGKIKTSQLYEIAKIKHIDMTAADLDAATKSLAGTALSMGIDVIEG